MEDTGDVNRTELNFKENNAQEELEVHIFDDPQNEVETVEEVEYADTVDSVSGVWKQVKTVQKKLLRIDVSNDPISATQLPILHANVLIFRTESALIFVDLIQLLFTRIHIDEFYDCDNEKGLLLLKATDFVKPCIFSIERQQSLTFLQNKDLSMKFVPNHDLILGQSGSSITLYKWDLCGEVVEKILDFEDPLINPQLPAIVHLERLVVFTELGVVMYNLTEVLSGGPVAQFAPLDELYFKREESAPPSSGTLSENTIHAIDCLDNFVAVAKVNSLSIFSLDKTDSHLTLLLLHDLGHGTQFSGFLHMRKHKTAKTESLKIFMTFKTRTGVQFVKFCTKTNVTQTILENLPDESEFWARGDHVAIVADQELKIFDTVNNEITETYSVGNVKDVQLLQLKEATVFLWLQKNHVYLSGKLLHEVALKVGEPTRLLPSKCNNAPVIIFLEESSKIRVLVWNQLLQRENMFRVVNLEFKYQIEDVVVVTSTRILIYKSLRVHILDLHKEQIMQTCNLSLDSKPLQSTHFNFNQSDFRTAVFLYKTPTGCFISIVDTLTGNILASKGIDDLEQRDLENIEIKTSSYVRVLALKSNSRDPNRSGETVVSKIVVSNPSLESTTNKIRMEFPQVVKNAYSIASEFSPLRRETFASTRPMNILVD